MAATSAHHSHPAAGAPPVETSPPPASLVGLLVLLLRFAAAMAVALALASLPASALFAIREIAVAGAEHTPAAAIIARSGLRPGDRLFAASPIDVAGHVGRLPRVVRAQVHLALNGRVTIRVVERQASAAVPFRGQHLIVDATGVLLEIRPTAGPLPVVSAEGFAPPWVLLGDRLPDARIALALRALQDLPTGLAVPGASVRADRRGDLHLATADGIAVRLGRLPGLRERAAVLGQLVAAVRERGLAVEYLDVRFTGNVVMKPARAAPAGERP